MNTQFLESFFENPTTLSAVVVVVFILSQVAIVWLQNRKYNKDRKRNDKTADKTISSFEGLSDKIQSLIDKDSNHLTLSGVETIITTVMKSSEAKIIREVRRIFFHNHREQAHRKTIIRRSFGSLTRSIYENDINELHNFYYKNKRLSEFVIQIDTFDFFETVLNLIFTVNHSESDMQDVIYSIETYFDSYIIQAKQYYGRL
ncbi:MAG: hypothetical protein U9N85_01165 [Bacteroidota bacterium]|nr:hypothetical protein [Bacteroidota bacterium]